MAVEIAIILGLISLCFFFLYAAFNIEKKHTSLQYLFFVLSFIFLYATLTVLSNMAYNTTSSQITNSTYDSDTGITTYGYSTTKPYEKVADVFAGLVNVVGIVIFILIGYFLLILVTTVLQKMGEWRK